MSLDRIDIAILDTLQKDGRISNAALAERVGLSQSACSRRLDNLEKTGVVRGYHARLSNAALGHQMTAIVHISLSGQFENRYFKEEPRFLPFRDAAQAATPTWTTKFEELKAVMLPEYMAALLGTKEPRAAQRDMHDALERELEKP